MRLTLRTLLAYLDDVLEPSETKLIGQKIQESAVAGKLISLIRLVVRQRRLKAPGVSGPTMGIDPNVIAQYLDNTLPSEQVVDVEKVLLTSDELLAEVASCHQVLALVVGKPVEVSDASRERLYALGPVTKSEQLRVDDAPAADNALAAAAARDAERVNGAPRPQQHVAHEIPDYLRPNPWSQRVVPTAIMVLLVIVCAGFLYFDPSLLEGIRQAKHEMSNSDRSAKPEQTTSADSTTAVASNNVAAPTTATQMGSLNLDPNNTLGTQQPAIPPSPANFNGIDPAAPADVPEPSTTVGTKVKPASPVIAPNGVDAPADAVAAAKGTTPAPGTPIPNPPPTNSEQPAVKAPWVVQYVSTEGVALRFDETSQHWFQLPRRSVLAPGELLAVPEPFEALLDFEHGVITAVVLGDSNVRVLSPNRVTPTGLDIRRGRIMLRAKKDLPPNCVLSITVGNDTWILEFVAPDTVCAIDVVPREPVQLDKAFDQNWYVGVLRVLGGQVKWTFADGQSQLVPAQTALEIVPTQANPGPKPAPVSTVFTPEWTDASKRKLSPLRRSASIFEKEFDFDQPVEQTLLASIRDQHAKVSELAIRNLALIDSYTALAQALAECEYEEGRFAAREGLRAWLGRAPGRGELLKDALATHFPPIDASAIYILLWGFRPDEGTNKVTSMELVSWLRSTNVAVRELAYYWVNQLSGGRKWEFRAIDVLSRRDAAIRKIEAHVQKDGALVKPIVKEPTPAP